MIYENVQRYSYFVMCLNIGFMILAGSGIFPTTSYSIGGYNLMESLDNDIESIKVSFENASGGLDYAFVAGFAIINGIQIIIKFIGMVLLAVPAICEPIGMPALIYIPMGVLVDCIVMYDFGKLILKVV
jgi:hypothetical protein